MADLGETFDPMAVPPRQPGDKSIPIKGPRLSIADAESQFGEFIRSHGLNPPSIIASAGFQRFHTTGNKSKKNGWYVLSYYDGHAFGSAGCWAQDGKTIKWTPDYGRELTPTEKAEENQKRREHDRIVIQEEQAKHAEAAQLAREIWDASGSVSADHPYLNKKSVDPTKNLKVIPIASLSNLIGYCPKSDGVALEGQIVVVLYESPDGNLSTLGFIDEQGRKNWLPGGKRKATHWQADALPADAEQDVKILIGEGVATVLSAMAATGFYGLAAGDCHNLKLVARTMRERFPNATIIILSDLGNGQKDAEQAAASIGGPVAIPDFGDSRADKQTDFNDLAIYHGLDTVKQQIEAVVSQPWPVPQPLTAKIPPEPYPLDALPINVRDTVEEVQGFVQAPTAMVATCALSSISIATQGHVGVRRADGLEGPSGIYTLGIAPSGERKSSVDGYLTSPIREHQSLIDEVAKGEWAIFKKDKLVFDAEMAGLRAALTEATKKGTSTDKVREKIDALQAPDEPKVPKYLFDDATPEELTHRLFKQWRVAAIVSSEAGSVFGGHGMNPDSVMRALSTLNKLWSGESIDVARRTSESFELVGARFSISLQVQEQVLRAFFDKAGDIVRGSGFLARFLVLNPDSTQGYRPFKKPPKGWPALTAYKARMSEILQVPIRFRMTPEGHETDIPDPNVLRFAPDAQEAWIDFYNHVEKEIRPGGEAHEVSDVASKTADNAARIAGTLHCYVYGPQGEINAEIFDGASRIAAWHLNEARRFLGEVALPQELADAVRLDQWLIKRTKAMGASTVPKNETRQYGPVRDSKRLTAAIDELINLERVRVVAEGRKTILQLNPGLI